MSGPAAFGRLIGAAWMLVRNDALLPHELEPLYGSSIATLSKVLRVFAGPRARVESSFIDWASAERFIAASADGSFCVVTPAISSRRSGGFSLSAGFGAGGGAANEG